MKRCVIFGAGAYDLRTPEIKKGDFVIAADGGFAECKKLGVAPVVTIGDFDSCKITPDGEIIKLPVEKDITDLDAAVGLALKNKCGEIHIYGGLGGRPDHSLANISLAARLSKSGVGVYLYGENYDITAVCCGKIVLFGKKGSTISIFSWTEKSEGVTLKGLKYPLENAQLTNTFALGISNSFIKETAEISVKKGVLIVMRESFFRNS